MFDAIELKEALSDVYDVGIKDDNLCLIYIHIQEEATSLGQHKHSCWLFLLQIFEISFIYLNSNYLRWNKCMYYKFAKVNQTCHPTI